MRLQLRIFKSTSKEGLEIKSMLQKNNTATSTTEDSSYIQEIELLALNEITIMRNDENLAQIEILINNVPLTVV